MEAGVAGSVVVVAQRMTAIDDANSAPVYK